jgi:hypothetical protein
MLVFQAKPLSGGLASRCGLARGICRPLGHRKSRPTRVHREGARRAKRSTHTLPIAPLARGMVADPSLRVERSEESTTLILRVCQNPYIWPAHPERSHLEEVKIQWRRCQVVMAWGVVRRPSAGMDWSRPVEMGGSRLRRGWGAHGSALRWRGRRHVERSHHVACLQPCDVYVVLRRSSVRRSNRVRSVRTGSIPYRCSRKRYRASRTHKSPCPCGCPAAQTPRSPAEQGYSGASRTGEVHEGSTQVPS